ncbi:MAG: PilZ domain-containing protein [Terracidiphilus sp.]
MEEAENANGLGAQDLDAQELERREMPRCAVDEEASLLLVSHGSAVPCRIVELSLGGCRMALQQRVPQGRHAAVEAIFKIRGFAFRLSGIIEWTSGSNSVGVSFGPMSSRRRDDLMEVLCEAEAENAAKGEQRNPETPAKVALSPVFASASIEDRISRNGVSQQSFAPERAAFSELEPEAEPAWQQDSRQSQAAAPAQGRKFRILDFIFRRARKRDAAFGRENRIAMAGPAAPNDSRHDDGPAPALGPVLVTRSSSEPVAAVPRAPSAADSEPETELKEQAPAAASPSPNRRERRSESRCDVDTSAVIFLVKIGSKLTGQILDLSLGGCRIRTAEKFPVGIYTRVETEFRIQGQPLRLGGVIQAIHDRHHVGIRFLDLSTRKREQVAELIMEIDGTRRS